MKLRLLALGIGSGMLLAAAAADRVEAQSRQGDDMRRAIAWEHYKDLAAARQAVQEKKHPSVTYNTGEANRSDEHNMAPDRRVTDPGSRDYRVTKENDKIKK